MVLSVPVVSVDPTWKMKTLSGLPCPLSVRVPLVSRPTAEAF